MKNRDASIEIEQCLNLDNPTSFFLYAGAGSGKTRSVIDTLSFLLEKYSRRLQLNNQRIQVITYTNAACDEITSRLKYNPLVQVSTIHSFAWSLLKSHQNDIRKWLKSNLNSEISDLEKKHRTGKPGSATHADRANKIESKKEKLNTLDEVKTFKYNPNGDNIGKNSLNHSEVIEMCSDFLSHKPLMQNLVTSKFPVLLIDESQDTKASFMDGVLSVQDAHKSSFILGLFGDVMQRIYGDGKTNLQKSIPPSWKKPKKTVNYRCPKRIIELLNSIRSTVDGHTQTPSENNEEGTARLFIANANTPNKQDIESTVANKMSEASSDDAWLNKNDSVKTLILEHHMAAKRLGFLDLYKPLYEINSYRTSLLDGTLPILNLFSKLALPIFEFYKSGDRLSLSSLIRKNSPLLSREALEQSGEDQTIQLKATKKAADDLVAAIKDNDPSFLDVLESIQSSSLFNIPNDLKLYLDRQSMPNTYDHSTIINQNNNDEEISIKDTNDLDLIHDFLTSPFKQISSYKAYVNQQTMFDTHQGVKGREFPRVLVIIDDTEARGFLFSYEKLFGVKEKTETDIKNETSGKDTSIDRTKRLFYVTCSRAEKSLAILVYSNSPKQVADSFIEQGWFTKDEIEILTP